jgi:hypothetical protein
VESIWAVQAGYKETGFVFRSLSAYTTIFLHITHMLFHLWIQSPYNTLTYSKSLGPFSWKFTFWILGPFWRCPILEAGMFRFTGHWPRIVKLLNTKYEQKPVHPYRHYKGAHPYIHTNRWYRRNRLFRFRGGLETCKSVKIFQTNFFHNHNTFSCMLRKQETMN